MCGLSAVYGGRLSLGDLEVMRILLFLSDLRGGWGAGCCSVNKKNQIFTIKDNFAAADLIQTKAFNTRMKDDLCLVVGHSRYPTKGRVTRADAHPHLTPRLVGVHNGTFRTILGKTCSDTESDSLEFFKAVSEHGIQKVVNESSGAYALMWVDKDVGEFNVLRNHERPLYAAFIKPWIKEKGGEYKTVFFSSEKRMLEFALSRQTASDHEIREVPPNVLWTWPTVPAETSFGMPKETPVEKTYRFSSYTRYYDDDYETVWDSDSTKTIPHTALIDGHMYDVRVDGTKVPWSNSAMMAYALRIGDKKLLEKVRENRDKLKGILPPLLPPPGDVLDFTEEDSQNVLLPFQTKITPKDSNNVGRLVHQIRSIQQNGRGKGRIKDTDVHHLPSLPWKPSKTLVSERDFSDEDTLMCQTTRGVYVSLKKYTELLNKGCSYCSRVPDDSEVLGQTKKPYFFSRDEFLCHQCMTDKEALEIANISIGELRK